MDDMNLKKQSGYSEVSLPPVPSVLIESLRNIGYTMETAVADIIDNSVTAKASRISIQFEWDNGSPWIAIIDNGYGMDKEVLQQAMRFGSNSPINDRDVDDLGRFGLGMKTASISQCRRITVCSKRDDCLHSCEWDLDQFNSNSSDDWNLRVFNEDEIRNDNLLSRLVSINLSEESSGTIVLWRNLDTIKTESQGCISERRFNEIMINAKNHIRVVFHRFINPEHIGKGIKIDFNNNPLAAFNPFGPAIPARQELPQEVINVGGSRIVIQPYVLPHRSKTSQQDYDLYAGDEGYLQNQGFYVYRNKRLIMKATWFRLIRKEELNKLIRVRIDVPNHLDHLWNININKSQVNPPQIVRQQLKKIINKISGRGKRVFKQRGAKLINKGIVPLWNREVIEGKVYYAINYDHPIIEEVFGDLEDNTKSKLISCLDMIVSSFPYDVYYSDAASDKVEINKNVDTERVLELCRELIKGFKRNGVSSDTTKEKMGRMEIPSIDPLTIDQIIDEVYNNESD